jgi:Arc/MetJ-type ribon-helix-helix transcriptional regulator
LEILAILAACGVMIAIVNISLPVSLKTFVDARVKSGGYASHSEYLRDLIRREGISIADGKLRLASFTI